VLGGLQLDDVLVAFASGIEVKKRRHFLRSYDHCFVGSFFLIFSLSDVVTNPLTPSPPANLLDRL
jgi:hypothetical protein